MNTIQEVIDSGAATHLGPVTIENDYGLNDKVKKTKLRRMLISDGSKKTILKLWGKSADANVTDGDSIEVRAVGANGKIETEEYDGKISLSANNCVVTLVGSGNKATNAAQKRHAGRKAAAGPLPSMKELIDYGMKCVKYARKVDPEAGDALLAGVYGSAMYGMKEGRSLAPAKPQETTAVLEPGTQEDGSTVEPVQPTEVPVSTPEVVDVDDDDIPF